MTMPLKRLIWACSMAVRARICYDIEKILV